MTPVRETSITVNSRKYDGTVRRSWAGEVVATSDSAIDLVGVFDGSVDHPDLGRIEQDTVSHERFYRDRWYNYFRFEHPSGTLRNYYINICMPPSIGDHVIDYVDLDIDIIVWPDGRIVTLDLDEFTENARIFGYPADVVTTAQSTLDDIHRILRDADSSAVSEWLARL